MRTSLIDLHDWNGQIKVMKIRAELLLIGHEEDIGAFLFKKKAMLMNSPGAQPTILYFQD